MAYIFVNSFKRGLDARRGKLSAQQGSLVAGRNIHINRGGEIEKRKAFVPAYVLPAGTFGLHANKRGLHVFGSVDAVGLGLPTGVRYQRLVAPGSPEMTELVSVDAFNGVPYTVARFANGSVHHFYNGVRVTDWDILAPPVSDLAVMAEKLAALVNTDTAVSAEYELVGGTAHTVKITGSKVAESQAITASVVNAGLIANNDAVVTITVPADVAVAQTVNVELTGSYNPATDADDAWTITVDGRSYHITGSAAGVGSTARTYRGKIYATVQGLLYFSEAQNPMRWVTSYAPDPAKPTEKVDTFAGFEAVASQTSSTEELVTVAPYQNHLAVFSRRSTQIWIVVPGDPKDNVPVQILDNVGTFAPRSAVSFGQLDVFFLSDSGIRSLRARDASDAAVVFDVGTAIDPLVREALDSLTEQQRQRACGTIEPRDGRYMLALGSTVFVFSFYPASDISAWTTYEPGFAITDFATVDDRLYCRSGDTVYLLGGATGNEHDDCEAFVELSWLDAEKPAHVKTFTGVDLACEGTWKLSYNLNPRNENFVPIGHVKGQTFTLPAFAVSGRGTHFGLRLTCNDAKPSRVSSSAVHFTYDGSPK